MTENGIRIEFTYFLRSFQNNLGLWPTNLKKKKVETQSKEMFLIFRTTPSGVLQPLRWRFVDCVIHHERDVREE